MDNCRKRFIIVPDITLSKGEKGDPGEPGENGALALPLSAVDIVYVPSGQTLAEILDDLLYTPLTISSFSAAISNYEKGQVLTSVFLSWAYNKTIVSQTITGTDVVSPVLAVEDTSSTVTLDNIEIDTVITLTAEDVLGDDIDPVTATVALTFLNKIHWGVATYPVSVNSAFLLSLQGELSSSRVKSFTATSGANQYIWFAIPATYGDPTFIAGGFVGGFVLDSTISHTNASGHTEDYYVYRSINTNLGTINIDVI